MTVSQEQAELQAKLKADLAAFIANASADEEDYDRMALAIFRYQFQYNVPFRKFCQQKGKTLRTVKKWQDIPPVPINAFKEATLSCVPAEDAQACFMTSGTTKKVRGKHYHPDTDIYDLSMQTFFAEMVMGERERFKMGVLFPDERHMPHSSLAHYLTVGAAAFGIGETHFYIEADTIDYSLLEQDLEQAIATNEPFLLLGATYSLAMVLEAFAEQNKTYRLPEGSKIFDTGGFKSYAQKLTLDEFYDRLAATFAVPRSRCVNMYGMTELSTEYYDKTNETVPSVMYGPHWMRTRIIHPLTNEDVAYGEQGIIVHYDLANYNSVLALQTEDVGYQRDGGFVLLGRAQGSDAKGCSISLSEFMDAVKRNG